MNGVKVIIGTVLFQLYTYCSPENFKELFNLRHSSLRNAIERIFGVLKKRFKILRQQGEYLYEIQVRLVKALCCLHNIIRIVGGDDEVDKEWNQEIKDKDLVSDSGSSNESISSKAITAAQTKEAIAMRDRIAMKMWTQYSRYRSN